MKFINYLTSITGVEIFPLISLLIFFFFFVLLSVYLFRADKEHITYMAEMPVEKQNGSDKPEGL
jgi:hypothetical protein